MAQHRGAPARQLTDPKGLGKPPCFHGVEAEFHMWARKTENYILSVYPEGRDLLRVAAESQTDIAIEDLKSDPDLPDAERVTRAPAPKAVRNPSKPEGPSDASRRSLAMNTSG